ncbi:hypothetical protein ASC89_22080 [Devosia sp. Root413D1]|uniref:gamma-glutamylcyclotransferase family protein n=1 Tax=Devosia sp. Root413D1 TaxID=1736531 RepID=UPI0006FACFEC|nr:gamma-glutamylcyclotransferase family protein [Devosia sp. Root413D1]KQW75628.1 hypothetical protein ASC89_22080 [Devosia sp. Root413D1]
MINYFAYGSNLCTPRLRARVPGCRVLSAATLTGYALRFHKISKDGSAKCNALATGDHHDVVYGVVFEIPEPEKPALDAAEGLNGGYEQHTVAVRLANGRTLEVVTYIAASTAVGPDVAPYTWYKDFVLAGAGEHALPTEYIARYMAAVPAWLDPDQGREINERRKIKL